MDVKANRFVVLGYFHSLLEDKKVLIVSLPDDSEALLPFSITKNFIDNLKLLSPGDLVGITGCFVKSNGKFCKLHAEKVTFMQGINAGKGVE